MYISILTHERDTPLSINYINYMYPADKLFNSCVELRSKIDNEKIPVSTIKDTSLAGPLRKLPNDITGEKRLQKLKEQIDRNMAVKSNMLTDRMHWKNKAVIPSRNFSSLAPIQPSTLASTAMKANSGRAMALGMVLQKGRAMLLFDIIRQNVRALANRVHNANLESSGCILIVNVKYLKVEREYGKAPQLSRVSLASIISQEDKYNFDSSAYVRGQIANICEASAKAPINTKFQIVSGQYGESYSTAVLFIKCTWE
ncbi:hypothetical protein EX191_05110 [Vibrio chemaguriensis]|uniref:Uncharacterized protein n=2 Tax=Vibrio TaxID=662 RepID=A0ABX1HUL5_9VIBR|nr:hypothetical protein [Vibrio chemaguriensis]NKJ67161.1 hypothetical protein [Vibrio chemaguriensis]CDT79788.1 hypothetical protein VDIAB_100718 [Vibrio diabolicus]